MNPYDSTMSRPTSSGIASPPRLRSRTQSISSDRPSIIAHSLMSPPLSVSPEAAFIAASAASQIVTNDHDSHADTWYDQHGIEPAGETALVSPGALQLVNNFLDQLLFNFLHMSRATTLTALRPAVSEVLKPKLAKDAINIADEELREYLGGGDEDDFVQPHGADPSRDWDLELVWKRTRLRCMVYSSLGDMEEEDEDYYMEQEDLEQGADEDGTEVISPAVAIFLTSILEFMGEQALVVAGQAAYHRMRLKLEKELKDGGRGPAEIAERIVVEELDMERVALDRTLGRLWRAWKKRIRSPTIDGIARPYSQGSSRSSHFRQHSAVSTSEHPLPTRRPSENDEDKVEEHPAEEEKSEEDEEALAASIPLPIGDRDVDEIEVPGLVSYSDDESDETEDEEELPSRPKSLMVIPMTMSMKPDVSDEEVEMEAVLDMPESPILPSRKRSNSLPTLALCMPKRQKMEEQAKEQEDEATQEADGTEEPTAGAEEGEAKMSPTQTRGAKHVSKIGTQTEGEASGDEGGEDVGDFEILTSSRVSISGGSPIIPESARMPSTSSTGRPASIHSARLIEVGGPKSPVIRSRTPSIDRADQGRQSSLSRASSISTSPIVEEVRKPEPAGAILRAATTNAAARSPVEKPPKSITPQPDKPISETEEDGEVLSARVDSTPTTATIATPTSATMPAEMLSSQIKSSEAIFGSSTRAHPASPRSPRSPRSPQSPPRSPGDESGPTSTKVTILSTSNSTGPFFEPESPPEVPQKSPLHASRGQQQQARDRSSSKTINGNTSPTSIGLVSVDRSGDGEMPPVPSNVAPRPIHTSGSSGSGSTNRLKPVRTSEESGGNRVDVARNFEELIHSDQTIQYTLTPESMRNIDTTRSMQETSPVMNNKARKSDEARPVNGDRSRSSTAESQVKRTGSLSRATGLSSHPVATGLSSHPVSVAAASPPPPPPPSTKLNGPIPRAPPSSSGSSRTRVSSYQARDARVPRESVLDIAEFIRNTGPSGADSGPAPLRNVATSMASAKNSIDSRRISSASNRPRLQARDAAVDNKEDNSDLIDFIRRGPPSVAGNPRIPRTVAPFRTTMDSDQMSGAVGGKAVDASLPDIRYSQASTSMTNESSMAAPSMHSVNSQSALLRNKPSYQNSSFGEDDGMMPKRKTRRVKDPYAIDFSDEEEDEIYGHPKPKAKPAAKEESLADFLKNYQPPSEAADPSPMDLPKNKPKKKSSAPSLMGRFTRTSTNGSHSSPAIGSGSNGSTSRGPPPVAGAGSGRGYVPIQVNMPPGYDKYGPIDGPTGVPKPSTGRVPMKKFEPREPVPSAARTDTSDLADFLRNSAPPPSMAPQYSPSAEAETTPTFKMFGRRKKPSYT